MNLLTVALHVASIYVLSKLLISRGICIITHVLQKNGVVSPSLQDSIIVAVANLWHDNMLFCLHAATQIHSQV